jgi:hypothetical protein
MGTDFDRALWPTNCQPERLSKRTDIHGLYSVKTRRRGTTPNVSDLTSAKVNGVTEVEYEIKLWVAAYFGEDATNYGDIVRTLGGRT